MGYNSTVGGEDNIISYNIYFVDGKDTTQLYYKQ